MKSAMPYFGLPSPRLKAVLRPLLRGLAPEPTTAQWEATVRHLWDGAATARSGTPPSRSPGIGGPGPGWTRPAWTSGGTSSSPAPGGTSSTTSPPTWSATCWRPPRRRDPGDAAWATDDDLWLRRTAVICQVGHQARHRPGPAAPRDRGQRRRPSFWLRKAIGWALRQLRPRPTRTGCAPRSTGSATGCPACHGARPSSTCAEPAQVTGHPDWCEELVDHSPQRQVAAPRRCVRERRLAATSRQSRSRCPPPPELGVSQSTPHSPVSVTWHDRGRDGGVGRGAARGAARPADRRHRLRRRGAAAPDAQRGARPADCRCWSGPRARPAAPTASPSCSRSRSSPRSWRRPAASRR